MKCRICGHAPGEHDIYGCLMCYFREGYKIPRSPENRGPCTQGPYLGMVRMKDLCEEDLTYDEDGDMVTP